MPAPGHSSRWSEAGFPAVAARLAALLLGLLAGWPAALAGTSGGAGSLLVQSGSGAPLTRGDYVSSAAGLNTYYSYFIEVPPGTSSLQIDIFDLDVGANNDQIFAGNMFVGYTVINPNGLSVFGPFNIPPNACPICDNAWINLFTQTSPPPLPGHWELRIDTSAAVTAGNDDQGYGVRAHDGNPGAGGRELNVYVASFIKPGQVAAGQTGGQFHPYVTSGCSAQSNDFDWDQMPSPGFIYNSVDPDPITAPPARFTTGPMPSSGNGVWQNQPINRWNSDTSSSDYGVWTFSYRLSGPAPGDGNGNNALLYVGRFNAVPAPPFAQPQPNTFRIYLPTDAGGPPVKPQIGQDIIGVVSGADPPATGQTTVLRVAVGINNPTPYPITFSTPGNVVTVQVPFSPGNRVLYQGNPLPTQGTIVSQPGIGTSGTLVWNPGVVPAGGTAQLAYDVSVRPQNPDTRMEITGTPAANGTTAAYVDETCSGAACGAAALARATHTFGPLCELAIIKGVSLATLAVVDGVRAYRSKQGTVVEWTTLGESATIGFHLLRRVPGSDDYERVNDRLLPGLLHSPNGGTYRYVDPQAKAGETHTYQLVEVEATGERIHHGPYTVVVAHAPQSADARVASAHDAPVTNLERVPRPPSSVEKSRREARKAARGLVDEAKRKRKGAAAKVSIREAGLYYLSAAEIAEVLGVSSKTVDKLLRTEQLSLLNRGLEVATLTAPDDQGLYFYGESVASDVAKDLTQDRRDHQYTDENVYWLQRGHGLTMGETDGGRPLPAGSRDFDETVRVEGNKYSLTHLFDDPDADYWMWDFRVGGMSFPDCAAVAPPMPCYVTEYSLPSPAVVAGAQSNAILTVNLHGGSSTAAEIDHRVTIKVNDTVVGTTAWDGLTTHSARIEIPHGLLRDGVNSVSIDAAPSSDPDLPSIVYLNDLELRYRRAFCARDDSLTLPSEGRATATIDGFQSPDIWVFDISDPKRPTRVANATIDAGSGDHRVSFVTASQPRSYLAVGPHVARAPISIVADAPSTLLARQNRVDYLIITDTGMMDAAEAHADYRRSKGMRTMVVDIEDIYDEFNHGIRNADAIWQFLRHAHTIWQAPPRYVLIAGEGSHDYKDYLGNGDAIIPTLLTPTPRGLFPSDNLFVDVVGNDRLPEMAVGRIPVMNADELRAFTRKIIAYEGMDSDHRATGVMLAADAPDDGGNFPADSELIAGGIPDGLVTDRIYLDTLDPPAARRRLIDGLNSGRTFMNFIGHGSNIAIGNHSLLAVSDLDSLRNGDRLPVVTAQTCLAGQFGFPGVDGIGELLVLSPGRGAIAVWAPSGLSMNNQARFLGQNFYRSRFEAGELVIGEAVRDAQARYLESHDDGYLLDIFNLIGDPATIMK